MIDDETDETIEELFEPLPSIHQKGLEESMEGRYFIFDYVGLLRNKYHKINLNRRGSYT